MSSIHREFNIHLDDAHELLMGPFQEFAFIVQSGYIDQTSKPPAFFLQGFIKLHT
jgi:hypothetical protein